MLTEVKVTQFLNIQATVKNFITYDVGDDEEHTF
jgi:hypothetical protein